MGMSASQARLLSITSRMNDVEFKSQQISNTKIRLADESEQVANDYTKALNKQKYTMTSFSSGHAVKVDLTVASLSKSDSLFKLKSRSGKTIVTPSTKNNFESRLKNWNRFINGLSPNETDDYAWAQRVKNDPESRYNECVAEFVLQEKFGISDFKGVYENLGMPVEMGYQGLIDAGKISQDEINEYAKMFDTLFAGVQQDENGYVNTNATEGSYSDVIFIDESCSNDPSWIYDALESGEFYLADSSLKEVSPSSTPNISIESDTIGLAKAEADYNSKTAKINSKEKLLDNDLKALDTEHSALSTEMDSIKSLIKDNVDKTFNLFS